MKKQFIFGYKQKKGNVDKPIIIFKILKGVLMASFPKPGGLFATAFP